MSNESSSDSSRAVFGNLSLPSSFWLYEPGTGYDLTYPSTPTSPTVSPAFIVPTTQDPITISPSKSALVIIDMQNFFASPLLGKPKDSTVLKAQDQLLEHALPAARNNGIQVIWLNWGLTQKDLDEMPPAVMRAFSWPKKPIEPSHQPPLSTAPAKQQQTYDLSGGLGSEIGRVQSSSSTTINAGRALMRDTWNACLTPSLRLSYESSLDTSKPDQWIHKNRVSGLWGSSTPCTEYLDAHGIRTLFFAGTKTDSCVLASVLDAYNKGYDCVLLSDGCATSAPQEHQRVVESNLERTIGFVTTCKQFAEMVERTSS